ncbi:hypothetical protein [Lysobacter gummosus]|uniref:hypothetical protein n=1 Tax=Lysobacter gummosus TaxID=262324 RepID=UPI003632B7AB
MLASHWLARPERPNAMRLGRGRVGVRASDSNATTQANHCRAPSSAPAFAGAGSSGTSPVHGRRENDAGQSLPRPSSVLRAPSPAAGEGKRLLTSRSANARHDADSASAAAGRRRRRPARDRWARR